MTTSRSTLFVLLTAFLAALLAEPGRCPAASQQRKAKIVAIASHGTAPYEDLLAGFKRGMEQRGQEVEISVFSLDEYRGGDSRFLEQAAKDRVDLIFAIGANALDSVSRASPGVPILSGLILSAEELNGKANATGVVMEFPVEIQFEKMRQFLPNCRHIGVVYSPANAAKIEHAVKVAGRMGLFLHGRQINGPSELPAALDHLANRVEILWGIPDEMVFTPQTAKNILLYSLRNRIPLIGLSGVWTKAGALYSLEWDYQDLGEQCAEMAVKILGGASPGSLPITGPRKIVYSLNLKTASHMKLDIPAGIANGASQIFR